MRIPLSFYPGGRQDVRKHEQFFTAGRVFDSNSGAVGRIIFPEIAASISCRGSQSVWSKPSPILVNCVHLATKIGFHSLLCRMVAWNVTKKDGSPKLSCSTNASFSNLHWYAPNDCISSSYTATSTISKRFSRLKVPKVNHNFEGYSALTNARFALSPRNTSRYLALRKPDRPSWQG